MHDDEGLEKESFDKPKRFWTEKDWERCLLKKESLVDRYERAFNEIPERRWRDPLDLYYKIHHGLDFGRELEEKAREIIPEPEVPNADENKLQQQNHSEEISKDQESLQDIPAYKVSFNFVLEIGNHLNRSSLDESIRKEILHHAFRIIACIAAGDGLGYHEEVLCGNIVENVWALEHARKCLLILKGLGSEDRKMKDFVQSLEPIIEEIKTRIFELRSKVWW
jgi:hypothetical protein